MNRCRCSVVHAGQSSVWALDLFWAHPDVLGAEQLASALVADELAQMPLLDLLAEDLQAAVADPRQRFLGRAEHVVAGRGELDSRF